MQSMKGHRREQAKERQVACIRLTRGSADDSVWVLEEGVGGTFLTVGSDPECDWQVRAPGVMPQALSVLLIGGMVYVRSGPARSVRLNGALLSEDWTHVDADARIDMGTATLEVKLGKDALLPSLREVPAVHPHSSSRHAQPAPSLHERSGMRRTVASSRAQMHAAAEAPAAPRLDPRVVSAARVAHESRSARHEQARRHQEWQRRAQLAAAQRRKQAGGGIWLYLIGGVALAGAYVFWLSWLD